MLSIVMAADKNYYYPMMTAITSVLENKKPETAVRFYLFIDSDYSQEDKDRINTLLVSKGSAPAQYLDVSEVYAGAHMNIEHITAATYYRLKILSTLPELDKCLYLDVDTLVLKDLSDLYDRSIDDAYLMGVLAAGYQTDDVYKRNKARTLGIPNMDSYVNAGVLVFNLALMRKDGIEARFERLLNENFSDQDQDILNAACYGGIKLAPPEWNAMTKYEFEDNFYDTDNAIPKCWSKWEWDKARMEPAIIHYADQDKPWINFSVPFAKEWWHYAKLAGIAEESFTHFFNAHAAVEMKIHKFGAEKRRLESEQERLSNNLSQVKNELSTTIAELKNMRQVHEKAELDLKAQIAFNKDQDVKLKCALQSQEVAAEELTSARRQTSLLEGEINSLKKQYKLLSSQSTTQAQQLQKAKQRVADLEHSNSYRLGRALSAPFRWVKRKLKKVK